jgi:adenylate cyclase
MVSRADILHGKILIVDDQEANVLLLTQMLRNEGYDSIASTMDPTQVCEMHLMNRYDLILLDLQMPTMDGFQVMENLRQIETSGYVPVLVITAQSAHKLRALRGGAKDFVSKPFDLAEVLLRVYNMLEVRLLHMEALQLYARIVSEQEVSKRLLLNLLPEALAEVLKGNLNEAAGHSPGLAAKGYAEVAVLFTDLVEFTKFAQGADAVVLMGVLDALSSRMPASAGDTVPERGRMIGDAYLAAGELPGEVVDHTIRAADKALDLLEAVDRFNAHSLYKLKLRIGLDIGAAAIGRKRKTRLEVQAMAEANRRANNRS